jgi:molecular chaperone DnaK (HSP70)
VLAPDRPGKRVWPGVPGTDGVAGSGTEAAAPQRVISATQQVVEPESPIVRGDGVLVESLGIESPRGGFLPLLQAGQKVPLWKPLPLRTLSEDQPDFMLHLLRGLSARAAEDHSLGWYRVSGLLPAHPGRPRAIVILRVAGGSVLLTAIDPGNGRGLPVAPADPPADPASSQGGDR